MTDKYQHLIDKAREATKNSYAPYSNYPVGAALLAKDGRVFAGCNIEIVSYEGSMCAERVALASAIAQGVREFEAVAVVAKNMPEIWPCGICRQYLAEFGLDLNVVVPCSDGSIKTDTLRDLLPRTFDSKSVLA